MVTPQRIQQAAQQIAHIAHVTPVYTSRKFDALSGVSAFFKCENLQVCGSFKLRGAANFLYQLSDEERRHGVVAYSSGNHAQAVAYVARHLNTAATIVMPSDAPKSKVEATRDYGATVILYDRLTESREAIGQKLAAETGATIVPPFDDYRIMCGQGTVAVELLNSKSNLEAIITPVSGGGLLAGCAVAAKSANPDIRIFGAEPELANDTYLSLQAGTRVATPPSQTIADGLRAPQPGELTFPILQKHVEQMLLVTEAEILATVKFFATNMKLVVEPSGAVAAAAVLHKKLPANVKSIGIVISGGNVDLALFASL